MKTSLILLTISQLILHIQAGFNNYLRPTLDPNTFFIVFDSDPSSTITAPNTEITSTLTSAYTSVSGTVSMAYLPGSNYIIVVSVTLSPIPLGVTLTLNFPSSCNNAQLTVSMLPYGGLSNSENSENWELTLVNLYSNYIFTAAAFIGSIINPYSLVYLNGKWFMQAMDTLKMANVQYSPVLNGFWIRNNNNRDSGLKAPNFLGSLIFGDYWDAGWTRDELSYDATSSRYSDDRIYSVQRVLQYNEYPLFIDNFGIEISVACFYCIMIAFFEGTKWFVEKHEDTESSCFKACRKFFRWNAFIVLLFADAVTGPFYSVVQYVGSHYAASTGHNVVNLCFAIVYTIIFLGAPIFIGYRVFRPLDSEEEDKFSVIVHNYHMDDPWAKWCPFIEYIKSLIYAAVIVAEFTGAYQMIILLVVECLFLTYIILKHPYTRTYQQNMQIFFEAYYILYLTLVMLIGFEDKSTSSTTTRETICNALLYLWNIWPLIATLACFTEYIFLPLWHRRQAARDAAFKTVPADTTDLKPLQNPEVATAMSVKNIGRMYHQNNLDPKSVTIDVSGQNSKPSSEAVLPTSAERAPLNSEKPPLNPILRKTALQAILNFKKPQDEVNIWDVDNQPAGISQSNTIIKPKPIINDDNNRKFSFNEGLANKNDTSLQNANTQASFNAGAIKQHYNINPGRGTSPNVNDSNSVFRSHDEAVNNFVFPPQEKFYRSQDTIPTKLMLQPKHKNVIDEDGFNRFKDNLGRRNPSPSPQW